MIKQKFLQRFTELENAFGQLRYTQSSIGSGTYVADGQWRKWATSAQNLITASFGPTSPHTMNFNNEYNKCHGDDHQVKSLNAVFQSAKEDYERGYVFNVELQVSGEVFGDFIGLARQALSEGHKDVAAVLACAALEDALKRFAALNGIDVVNKAMTDIINALKSQSLVSGAQKSLLDVMPGIRNAALHANWEKIKEPDVSSVIGFTEQFLLTKFSGE